MTVGMTFLPCLIALCLVPSEWNELEACLSNYGVNETQQILRWIYTIMWVSCGLQHFALVLALMLNLRDGFDAALRVKLEVILLLILLILLLLSSSSHPLILLFFLSSSSSLFSLVFFVLRRTKRCCRPKHSPTQINSDETLWLACLTNFERQWMRFVVRFHSSFSVPFSVPFSFSFPLLLLRPALLSTLSLGACESLLLGLLQRSVSMS